MYLPTLLLLVSRNSARIVSAVAIKLPTVPTRIYVLLYVKFKYNLTTSNYTDNDD